MQYESAAEAATEERNRIENAPGLRYNPIWMVMCKSGNMVSQI